MQTFNTIKSIIVEAIKFTNECESGRSVSEGGPGVYSTESFEVKNSKSLTIKRYMLYY